jgi:hypothetical protein
MKRIKKITGQSILELAIFGSILIMLLGAILSYGLRYGLEQKIMMSAFRKTLQKSAEPNTGGQASITVISDKHIPNPANPFAIGSVSPFISSASVIRSARLHETADTEAELPKSTIEIQGQEFNFRTAGFRVISNALGLEKYQEVYGANNVVQTGNGECVSQEINPQTGEEECAEYRNNIRIIDSCEGELMNYDSCKRQCRVITDVSFCVSECERGKIPGSETDCNSICSQQIENPWYCSSMDSIFNFAIAANRPRAMGVQSGYTQDTITNNILRKQEENGIITTTDTIDWSAAVNRSIVSIDQARNVESTTVSTTVAENAACVNAECN